jgi:hypothetical protein
VIPRRRLVSLETWWRARHFDLDHYRYEAIESPLDDPAARNGRVRNGERLTDIETERSQTA